ncbi:ExbD/TolR family protein [Vibrio algivorus]|uniref:Biopolymer transporter ExbD n=1 Tax=Vibrio algivorus TaxID=1667024 RepID=A0A557P8U5_9VIBR|nr:biopolymer transporter ExbD [Vibrio algivorus]TVO37048.1 biopolymer transporter ExbD [Vibrio algivorus]GLT14546.1 biopolymer transporter ExbD [Vibrio algivorus]
MIRSNSTAYSSPITPDLTPLLDIIFIVMVFLMLTASVKLSSLEVQLPSTESGETKVVEKQSITINILNQPPYWAINGKASSSWTEFQKSLTVSVAQDPKKEVIIAADKHAEIQHIVKLFGFLQQQNISATQILMEEQTNAK